VTEVTDIGVFCLSPQKGIVGIRAEGLTGNHRPMKRFFREVDAPPQQTESGHVHAAIPEAVTALSAARTDHTKPLSVCHLGVN
jgi:hypothetical protein